VSDGDGLLTKDLRNALAVVFVQFQLMRRRHDRGDHDAERTSAGFLAMDRSLKRMTALVERVEARLEAHS
jgi:hypothetical protein